MGSGKSAVGRRLAKRLQLEFCDSDELIESRTGVDIPFVFEKEGESGFRKRESAMLAELLQRDDIVLATGGGAVMESDNRRLLAQGGIVVYLCTSVAEQIKRTRNSSHRPLLNVENPAEVLEQLMTVRDPLYREVADVVVETDGRRVTSVTREVEEHVLAALQGEAAGSVKKS